MWVRSKSGTLNRQNKQCLRDTQEEGSEEEEGREEEKEMETVITSWPQRTLRDFEPKPSVTALPQKQDQDSWSLSKRRLRHLIVPDSSERIIRCVSWPWSLELFTGPVESATLPCLPQLLCAHPLVHALAYHSVLLPMSHSCFLFSRKWGEVGGLDDEGYGTFLWLLIKLITLEDWILLEVRWTLGSSSLKNEVGTRDGLGVL